jgi:antirestriction protein ArdC
MRKQRTNRFDVHEAVTNQIIAAIEAGAGEWKMPWHRSGGALSRPVNIASNKAYRGVNILSLWVAVEARAYTSNVWGTYRQWQATGAQVRKGEKGSLVVFYKEMHVRAEDGQADDAGDGSGEVGFEKRLFARASTVFNAAQVDGWKAPVEPDAPAPVQFDPVSVADTFIAGTRADIRHGGDRAFFRPSSDHIQMPPRDTFVGTDTSTPVEAYYSTLLHELVHWSGAPHRLDRRFGKRFGDDAYAAEELVAELGAAFLSADLEVSLVPRPDHAAYVASWLKVLKADKKAIFTAASKAQQAVEFLETLQKHEEKVAA